MAEWLARSTLDYKVMGSILKDVKKSFNNLRPFLMRIYLDFPFLPDVMGLIQVGGIFWRVLGCFALSL